MGDAAPHEPTDAVVVLVTVPDASCGEKIARALLESRLAACVTRLGPASSLFRWKGALDSSEEQLLLVKTRAVLFAQVEREVVRLHPYEVPEVVALPIVAGSAAYLRWIGTESKS
jgi:periplasmic divalent cation tolerance protein